MSNDWLNFAACKDKPVLLFFQMHESKAGNARAKRICASCPVQPNCLEYALELRPDYGIWAGYEPDELRKIRNLRRRLA